MLGRAWAMRWRCSRCSLLLLLPWLVSCLYDAEKRIESARLYGNIDEYAYWYVDLVVGTPPQRTSVIVDTGSGLAAFTCANCNHCGEHLDPNFDFEASSTAEWVPCGSQCTDRCRNDHCGYHQGYVEGSSIDGWWFKDYFRLGDTIQHNPAVFATMGCHNNENKLFYTQEANGILGIAPEFDGSTLIQELFKDSTHVDSHIFSICLAERGGRLVVGGHNASYHRGAIQYVPLLRNIDTYRVTLSSMSVNGVQLSTDYRSTMIDSGTTYTYMGSGPYRALSNAIKTHCRDHGNCGRNTGSCWRLSKIEDLDNFPPVEVKFGDVRTTWKPKAYLYRRGGGLVWCFAFDNDGPGAQTTLGASWMMHQDIIFDMQAHRVGIVPAECPEYRERPLHTVGGPSTTTKTRTTTSTTLTTTSTTFTMTSTTLTTTSATLTTTSATLATTSATLAATSTTRTTTAQLTPPPPPVGVQPSPPSTTGIGTTAPTMATVTRGETLPPPTTTSETEATVTGEGTQDEGTPDVNSTNKTGLEEKEVELAQEAASGVGKLAAILGGLAIAATCVGCVWYRSHSASGQSYEKQEDALEVPPDIVGSSGVVVDPDDIFAIDDDDENLGFPDEEFGGSAAPGAHAVATAGSPARDHKDHVTGCE